MREVTAQRFGCWHGALLIVSLVATTGCLLYRGDRQPNLIGTGARATAPDAPRIEVVLHHRHTIDGKDAGGQATELTFKQMKSSWERVQKETPFLANAGSGIAKADFVLDLDTEVAEHGKVAAIVSGATLLLFPGFISSNVMVKATLKNPTGETLGTHEASGQVKGIFHLLFAPILPIVAITAPGKELYDDTFRDVLIQVAGDLGRSDAPR
ncbi:MAG: hypothetical protein E6J68_15125 [Deltaproteobacteria bacterium]|nr:MAG: hypothetical protein E6J68_15125 [Deltaproteobacteria bacterium]TMA65535.1 MAG: hypothetical protein E6J69_12690 [Deltaproteobacteria bacterium]TMB43297.1 MAG: hypothetical protein E6J55_13430 [Deltaproteobacteria bacterium]